MKRMIVLAAVAAIAVLSIVSAGPAQTQDRAGASAALERSKALVAAQAGQPFAAAVPIPAATARVAADDVAPAIPLPAGGTFAGVRWEEAGGVLSHSEIAAVLQFNAACQWLRAWRDGRDGGTSAQVLADVPAWPAWRNSETSAVLADVAADVRAGGGKASAAVLADCDASHEREVAYATARGLTPTR